MVFKLEERRTMSGTNYTHEQLLKDRIAELELENEQLKIQLQLIKKAAQLLDQAINKMRPSSSSPIVDVF